MTKSRRPHPIVQVVQTAASELNDVLNAISLRISLLQHQAEAPTFEAEIARLARLIEKASQRIHRLDEYARAEELVASMRSSLISDPGLIEVRRFPPNHRTVLRS